MRLAPPDFDNLSPDQQRVYDMIMAGPRGRVRGPLALWLHRPELAEAAQTLGSYCRYNSSLPKRLSELAIMTLLAEWKVELPWWAHQQSAAEAGLSPELLDALSSGRVPELDNQQDRLVYEVTKSLAKEHRVPEALYREALETLGKDAMVDLVGVVGYYSLIAMTADLFDLSPSDGRERVFPPKS
ncbi:carboxymuconolactone decarboxylase family protein [Pelagibacterium limicola]|uniref:carboxymuconolactone decarboxylase family protein n=1 Tax=Pelagibacterium limicola TaxID=2791022 RepID=UPI0018B015AD|nr:carboxymuconolactone decarboxylase family protein [Pelagibacterium limicola]